nr:CsbD family protein [Amycolatopsis anabasis]
MALSDKFENKADDLGGKAKEAAGKVTGDERLEGEGKLDQAKAGVKDAVEKVKDVFKKD